MPGRSHRRSRSTSSRRRPSDSAPRRRQSVGRSRRRQSDSRRRRRSPSRTRAYRSVLGGRFKAKDVVTLKFGSGTLGLLVKYLIAPYYRDKAEFKDIFNIFKFGEDIKNIVKSKGAGTVNIAIEIHKAGSISYEREMMNTKVADLYFVVDFTLRVALGHMPVPKWLTSFVNTRYRLVHKTDKRRRISTYHLIKNAEDTKLGSCLLEAIDGEKQGWKDFTSTNSTIEGWSWEFFKWFLKQAHNIQISDTSHFKFSDENDAATLHVGDLKISFKRENGQFVVDF